MNKISPASIFESISNIKEDGIPPVHLWNPPICANVDMRISREGQWFFMNSPIGRERMVRLFSKVLRFDEDGHYYLVTPVEKIRLNVEDKPFLIVDFEVNNSGKNQNIYFKTNTDDIFQLSAKNPLRVVINKKQEPSPYVVVRSNLEGLISRNIYYKLIDLGKHEKINNTDNYGIWSAGSFFNLEGAKIKD
tara:strand:- start:785 stop:1357 length:573 start_codon:yes stop_codon:yes gene_type:complete